MMQTRADKPPAITLMPSIVFRCGQCRAWYVRMPIYCGLDKGDQCDKCGCTSFHGTAGRAYGLRSRRWPMIMSDWAKFWRLDCLEFLRYGDETDCRAVLDSCVPADRARLAAVVFPAKEGKP